MGNSRRSASRWRTSLPRTTARHLFRPNAPGKIAEVRVHPTADVQTKQIGPGTRIWQYCVILPKANIGMDCNIASHCVIENDVVVGDRVTVKCGVQLWDGLRVDDDVFIGPNVTFCNDRFPRSQNPSWVLEQTFVRKGASIGANATILPGLEIGEYAMVGAGAVVTRSVAPYTIVAGNPATVRGNVRELPTKGNNMERLTEPCGL